MTQEAKQIEVPNLEATPDGGNIHTETMAQKIPAIHEEKLQTGHHRTNSVSRNDTKLLDRRRNRNTRFHIRHDSR